MIRHTKVIARAAADTLPPNAALAKALAALRAWTPPPKPVRLVAAERALRAARAERAAISDRRTAASLAARSGQAGGARVAEIQRRELEYAAAEERVQAARREVEDAGRGWRSRYTTELAAASIQARSALHQMLEGLT